MTWTRPQPTAPALTWELVGFPPAGSSLGFYQPWRALLPPQIAFTDVLLPGRVPRLSEAPWTSVTSQAALIATELADRRRAHGAPRLALFGHSMGALMAYEVAQCLGAAGVTVDRLIVSGALPPHFRAKEPDIDYERMSDGDLIRRLEHLGGTPAQALASPEILGLVLPAFRADLTALSGYRWLPGRPLLSCPVDVFGGTEDPHVPMAALLGWQELTSRLALVTVAAGGHFYLETCRERLVKTIGQDLHRNPAEAMA